MNVRTPWPQPFNSDFGDSLVYRLFVAGGRGFAVGFEFIETVNDISCKGINIFSAHSAFRYPAGGVWGIIFDEIDPVSMSFKDFQHIEHAGLISGRVLLHVASAIIDHYNACGAGAYVFSAAVDKNHIRRAYLVTLYDGLLGLNGKAKSKLFRDYFVGWEAWSNTSTGGRDYVITTASDTWRDAIR